MKPSAICVVQYQPGINKFVGLDCAKGRGITFPGGKLEPGELYSECAARELQEETGLTVDPRLLTHIYESPISQGCPTNGFTYYCHAFHVFWEDIQGDMEWTPEGQPAWHRQADFMESSFRQYYEAMFQRMQNMVLA